MKLQDANLQVYGKNSFTYTPSCILPSFSQSESRLLLLKRLLRCASKFSFRKCKEKKVLLVICLLNYDSSKSIYFTLNMAFDFFLSKLEFIAIHYKDCRNILLFVSLIFYMWCFLIKS